MGEDDVQLDDKARRMRDLLSSFYSTDPSSASMPSNTSSRYATLDTINTTSFDADQYMNLLVQKSNLEGLLQKHVEVAAEIKNLDTDLQMLVYENYNKFISATDTIKRMKNNIVGMETNMEDLLAKIISVQSQSDGINTSLFEKREHIEKLHRTRNLLRKVQFIYDLPTRLGKCIKSEAYADAVRFYIGAMPIFKEYGDSSFLDCKRASEEAVVIIIKNLQGKLFSDSESIQARAEAVMLLKQLDFPVDNLKAKLLEKLEQFLSDLHLQSGERDNGVMDPDEPSKQGNIPDSISAIGHEAYIHEFVEAVRAYRAIFPDSEEQLVKLAYYLVKRHFEATQQSIKKHIHSADLLGILRVVWNDVLLLDEVLPEASLFDYTLEAARAVVNQYVTSTFSYLLLDISDALTKVECKTPKSVQPDHSLQAALEASKKAVIQGSMDVLLDFHLLLEEDLELLLKLRDSIIDWVQEGFQDFFRKLHDNFFLLSGKNNSAIKDQFLTEGMQGDKVPAGLVLVLAQLSVFTEQSAIPRITEDIGTSFSGGGIRGSEHGPAFIPAEICRSFRSAGEKFLQLLKTIFEMVDTAVVLAVLTILGGSESHFFLCTKYINKRTQKVSVLLRKRLTTPNWVKHKEPREVHMFVDLLLQELAAIQAEVKQILPQGLQRKHRRNDSNGSTTSSRSNPLRDDKLTRSNTQRARSQLLETHLAKLFQEKREIFTKVEHTQESVVSTIVKFCLKSLQEFVRLQTFNRSGFQQIQLDIQFLRTALKELVEDEAVVDFLLDEVIVAAAERSLDPIPLEPAILDKLIQAKSAKSLEHHPIS